MLANLSQSRLGVGCAGLWILSCDVASLLPNCLANRALGRSIRNQSSDAAHMQAISETAHHKASVYAVRPVNE